MNVRLKRYSFSLLEILITLPLLALLLGSLFQTYTSLFTSGKRQEKILIEVHKAHYFRQRLKKMLLSFSLEEKKIHLSKEGLEFYFDHGVNFNPQASNKVLGKLILQGDTLFLDVYKENHEESIQQKKFQLLRKEKFFTQIRSISYLWGYQKEGAFIFSPDAPCPKKLKALKLEISFLNGENQTFIFEV